MARWASRCEAKLCLVAEEDKDRIVGDRYGVPLRTIVPEAREAAIFGAFGLILKAT